MDLPDRHMLIHILLWDHTRYDLGKMNTYTVSLPNAAFKDKVRWVVDDSWETVLPSGAYVLITLTYKGQDHVVLSVQYE